MEARNQRPHFHEQIFTAIPRTQHHLASLPTPNQSTGPSRPVLTSTSLHLSPIQAPFYLRGMDFDGFRTPLIPTKVTQVTMMKSGTPVFDLCLEGEMQAHLAAEMGASPYTVGGIQQFRQTEGSEMILGACAQVCIRGSFWHVRCSEETVLGAAVQPRKSKVFKW